MVIKVGSLVRVAAGTADFPNRMGIATAIPYGRGNVIDVQLAGDEGNGPIAFALHELSEVVVGDDDDVRQRDLGIAIGYERAIRKLEQERNRERHLHDDLMKIAMGARAAACIAKSNEVMSWAERTATLLADDSERAARIHLGRSEGLAQGTGPLRLLRDELVEGFNEEQGREFAETFADDDLPF